MLIFHFFKEWITLLYFKLLTFDPLNHVRCPGCGLVGRKRMQFVEAYEQLILTCPRCSSRWGRDTVMPYKVDDIHGWFIQGLGEKMQELEAKELEKAIAEQKARLEK